ncbi:MAG: hypothetical protein N2512_01700 [Armatimonadetes bacterium]|nr:hypothetical protein [Armatimonadota bacterium]
MPTQDNAKGTPLAGAASEVAKLRALGAVGAGLVASVIMLWLLHLHLLPLGVRGQWHWRQRDTAFWPGPAVLLACTFVLLGAALALDAARRQALARRQAAASIIVLLTGSYFLAGAMLLAEPGGYCRATLSVFSDLSMGYLTEASKNPDFRDWLRNTKSRTSLGQVPDRVATHPPGPVLVFYVLDGLVRGQPGLERVGLAPLGRLGLTAEELLETARRVGSGRFDVHHVAVASLAVWLLMAAVPMAIAGAWLLGFWWLGERAGIAAAAVATVIPSLYVFTPGIDAGIAALAVWVLALWAWALKRGRGFIAAGVVWGLSLQMTFGLAALGVILLTVWLAGGRSGGWRAWAWLAAGVAVSHLPLVALGYDPLTNLAASLRAQHHIMASRSYAPWALMNAWDIIVFAGPALVALALSGGGRTKGLGLGLGATVVLLLLAGATRGEVGRIWCFLMPPMGLCAAAALVALEESAFLFAGTVVITAQLMMTTGLATYLLLVTP